MKWNPCRSSITSLSLALLFTTTSGAWAETEYPRVPEPVSLANERGFANNPVAALSCTTLMLGLGAVLCIGNGIEACAKREPEELLPPEDLDPLGIPKNIYGLSDQKAECYATDDLNKSLMQLLGVEKLPGPDDPEAQLELELRTLSRLSDGWKRLDAALGKQVLDIAIAKTESIINPDGIADHIWRETMTVVRRLAFVHDSMCARKPANVTMPSCVL